jgi:hypothetical protein
MSTVPSGTRFIGIAENVNLTERKSAVLNTETQPYTIQDIADTVGVGAQGPQGVQGPAGPLGPVGPAGLNWQGAWVSGTSYVADDAVGYGGASYFCILATSGTTTPNLATTNWALLASQGAQGIQGVQGPTGAQGASGGAGTLQQTVDNGNEVNDGFGNITKIYSGAIETIDIAGRITIGSDVDLQKGIYTAKIYNPGNHTANRTYTLPNASGTVALEDYKVYSALISQSGSSAPTAKVLKNTTGATFSYSKLTDGYYGITASSDVFTTDKTALVYSLNSSGIYPSAIMTFYKSGPTSFVIETLYSSNNADNIMKDTFIEIRVYN